MAAARVSIPAGVRRMIQDIKEIAGGHADEEVYAVLRECDMDPNEATQRLLSRGTFYEVKRKRDKKKEGRKAAADPRLRPGRQGQDVKGGLGNYSSREFSISNDFSGRKPHAGKDIGVNRNLDKGSGIFVNRNMESKTSTSSSSLSGCNGQLQHVAPIEKKYPGAGNFLISDLKQSADLEGVEDVTTSVLDVIQSIKLHISTAEQSPSLALETFSHGEICSTEHDLENQQTAGVLEVSSRPSSSVQPSGSMPSYSYSGQSQLPDVSQKAWNPKLTSKPNQAENVMFKDVPIRVGTVTLSIPVLNSARKEDPSLKVDKRISEMQQSGKQHVIIPDHLQVTESEKYGLSFGSFGTTSDQTASKGPECEISSTTPEDDSSQELHEVVSEAVISHQGTSSSVTVEDYKGLQQLSIDDSSPQGVYGSSDIPEVRGSDLAKDSSEASHALQDSVAQTTKQTDQTQLPEALESQVPRENDISECYTQLQQPITDVDGRITSFAAPINNGNILVSHAQTGEAQEGMNSNSFVVPAPGSAPFVPAVSGVVSSSIAIPQPPVPLFRQTVGIPLPHYGPGFIPYNHYISPFYYPPHTLNHFIGSTAVFPQSPSTGNMYQPVSVVPPVKYSSSTYKTDDKSGSQTHVGIPGAYSVYGSSPSVYTNNSVVMNGTSVETDDVSGSQSEESNVFVAGQQSAGSTVWIPAPGQDVSSLQPSPFSGLPSQGQHLGFVPPQAGQGAFRRMYHPAQTLGGPAFHQTQSSQTTAEAVERVGLPASAHQQPQHAQMNWGSY